MKHLTYIDGRLFGLRDDGRIGPASVTRLALHDDRQLELRAKLDCLAYTEFVEGGPTPKADPVQLRLRGVVFDLGTIRSLLEAGQAGDALQVVRYATHRIAEVLAIKVSPTEARKLDLPANPDPAYQYPPLKGP